MPERLPLGRRLLFGAVAIALAVTIAGAGLLAADVYLHHKYESVSAFNVWGYRGPAVPVKQAGERRVVVLGGSAAFGYGVTWNQAFPYLLEERLNAAGGATRYRVVNLAFNNESAASFAPTLEDYQYLDYDVAILYEGYNDLLERPPATSFRRQSTVFTATGYLPILPMILREKYFDLRYQGDIAQGYRSGSAQTAFRPSGDAAVATALASQVGSLTPGVTITPAGCRGRWSTYCRTVITAVSHARKQGVRVVVASQPHVSDLHVEQQAALGNAIQQRFAVDDGVRYLDLGRTVDLHDQSLAFDGMHLTVAGNRVIAEAFVQPVLALLGTAGQGR
jgi:lysophospholipase L1-like esterase